MYTTHFLNANFPIIFVKTFSGRFRGGSRGAQEPTFVLHLALRSTDGRLNGTPLSGYRTKKTAAMAHLRMLQKIIY